MYQSGVEVEQPGEMAMIDQIAGSRRRANGHLFEKRRHAVCGAQALSHVILKGSLSVYSTFYKELAQGIFQPNREYPVAARLSSVHCGVHSDEVRPLKGLAVKVFGVEGRKLLPGKKDEVTQDFLFVSLPVLPFGDVWSYLDMQRKEGERTLNSEPQPAFVASQLRDAVGQASPHILGETFHGIAAIRFGAYVAKLSVAPLWPSVTELAGLAVEIEAHRSRSHDQVVDFFRTQPAEYEIRAQLCTDLKHMPVEDASVVWDAELSPHLAVARLTFPPQDAYSAARRIYGEEVMSFNPWHCIEEHRPLGSVMRARIAADEAPSRFHHTMNGQPSVEPRDIAEIPD